MLNHLNQRRNHADLWLKIADQQADSSDMWTDSSISAHKVGKIELKVVIDWYQLQITNGEGGIEENQQGNIRLNFAN